MNDSDFIEGAYYLHFKGRIYKLLHMAEDSETGNQMVVYQACYGDNQIYVRPASMWNELVEVNGKSYKRFSNIDELTANAVRNGGDVF